MKDNKVKKLEKEIEVLKYIIRNTLWMSVRYAHGMHTYAPGIIRECVSLLKNLYPNEQFLRPDRTIQPPSPEELKDPMALRSDWLDDLLEDTREIQEPTLLSFYTEEEYKKAMANVQREKEEMDKKKKD